MELLRSSSSPPATFRPRRGWRHLTCLLVVPSVAAAEGARRKAWGIAYAPVPLNASELHLLAGINKDDFMSEESKPFWGKRGRSDLEIIRDLGANVLRTYGNDREEDHFEFLNEAYRLGLKVIPGVSYYPYTQMDGNCIENDFDCYSLLKPWFEGYLEKGFLTKGGSYHPALDHLIIINEPDAVMCHHGPDELCMEHPRNFSKAVISAVDAMLDAEKNLKVVGALINVTATMTFGTCSGCTQQLDLTGLPAVRQMIELEHAFNHPEEYGYRPNNDLALFFRTRYINSFNTHNTGKEVLHGRFLSEYQRVFPTTPLFIEEYHNPEVMDPQELLADLTDALMVVDSTPLLFGLTWFQFQAQYWKEDDFERKFGMFGLGNYSIASATWFGEEVNIWCLIESPFTPHSYSVVNQAFGGRGVDLAKTCIPDPKKVMLSQDGFEQIWSLRDVNAMAEFVERVVEHLGGNVLHSSGLHRFAERFSDTDALSKEEEVLGAMPMPLPEKLQSPTFLKKITDQRAAPNQTVEVEVMHVTFSQMLSELAEHPKWAIWGEYPACVADRLSNAAEVGRVIHSLCMKLRWFECNSVPEECNADPWHIADYVFSVYQNEQYAMSPVLQDQPNAIDICYFNGSGIYASSSYYSYKLGDTACVISRDPLNTPITEEGYHAIMSQSDTRKNFAFIERVVRTRLYANVTDQDQLLKLAAATRPPPDTLAQLMQLLSDANWVCDGASHWSCEEWRESLKPMGIVRMMLAWGWTACFMLCLGGLCCFTSLCVCCYASIVQDETEEWAARNKEYQKRLWQNTLAEAIAVQDSALLAQRAGGPSSGTSITGMSDSSPEVRQERDESPVSEEEGETSEDASCSEDEAMQVHEVCSTPQVPWRNISAPPTPNTQWRRVPAAAAAAGVVTSVRRTTYAPRTIGYGNARSSSVALWR